MKKICIIALLFMLNVWVCDCNAQSIDGTMMLLDEDFASGYTENVSIDEQCGFEVRKLSDKGNSKISYSVSNARLVINKTDASVNKTIDDDRLYFMFDKQHGERVHTEFDVEKENMNSCFYFDIIDGSGQCLTRVFYYNSEKIYSKYPCETIGEMKQKDNSFDFQAQPLHISVDIDYRENRIDIGYSHGEIKKQRSISTEDGLVLHGKTSGISMFVGRDDGQVGKIYLDNLKVSYSGTYSYYLNEEFDALPQQYSGINAITSFMGKSRNTWTVHNEFFVDKSSISSMSASIASDPLDDENTAMRLYRSISSSKPSVQRVGTIINKNKDILNSQLEINMRIFNEQLNTGFALMGYNTDGERLFNLSLQPENGKWVEITLCLDMKRGQFDLFENAEEAALKQSGAMLSTGGSFCSMELDLTRGGYTAESTVYIDDICVRSIDEKCAEVISIAFNDSTGLDTDKATGGGKLNSFTLKRLSSGGAASAFAALYNPDGILERICACDVAQSDAAAVQTVLADMSMPNCSLENYTLKLFALYKDSLAPLMQPFECETQWKAVSITGEPRAAFGVNDTNSFPYIADITSECGENVIQSCTWSISGDIPNGTTLDENGILYVTQPITKESRVKIKASVSGEAQYSSEMTVVLESTQNYNSDKARMNAVVDSIENILSYGADTYHNTPLLADGIDVTTHEPLTWQYNTDAAPVAISNLANQATLMRTMTLVGKLTGDESYKRRVNDIYRYYLDNLMSENNLLYWGGHTTFDLFTGDVSFATESAQVHELKNHLVYLEPFFELDPEKAAAIVRSAWSTHVTDFSDLLFSRHAEYTKGSNLTNTWYNLQGYDKSSEGMLIESTGDLPFRNAANDLLSMACTLYEKTGEREALMWSENLLNRYKALVNPDTNLGVYQFAQCKMKQNPMEVLEPIGAWYSVNPMPNSYVLSIYGDRAKNQFEDIFVEEGIIPESKRWIVREAYMLGSGAIYRDGPVSELRVASLCGEATAQGQSYNDGIIKETASYAHLAYNPDTNKFRQILSDGTDLTGYTIKRGGYYGDISAVFKETAADSSMLYSFYKVFEKASELPGYNDEKQQLWRVIKGMTEGFSLGCPGESFLGDDMQLNQETACFDPVVLATVLEMYYDSGNYDFLQLARKIGDNITKTYYNDGFFVNANRKYVKIYDKYAYVLALLEAAIRGDEITARSFVNSEPYFHADYVYPSGIEKEKVFDYDCVWKLKK